MIDPLTQFIIHQQQEEELMLQIQRRLAAQERGEAAQSHQQWYLKTGQWLKEKVFPDLRAISMALYPKNR